MWVTPGGREGRRGHRACFYSGWFAQFGNLFKTNCRGSQPLNPLQLPPSPPTQLNLKRESLEEVLRTLQASRTQMPFRSWLPAPGTPITGCGLQGRTSSEGCRRVASCTFCRAWQQTLSCSTPCSGPTHFPCSCQGCC